jgi:Mrp family chromosome partitioning ATPase
MRSGAIPPNPSELLGSLAAKKVLSELRADFDYVIVDSSPLLPVTDAAILAAASDGVLVIGRFGKTKRDQLAHAVGNLRNVEARILGTVFTMTPARGNRSYNYGYYGDAEKRPSSSQATKKPGRRRRQSVRVTQEPSHVVDSGELDSLDPVQRSRPTVTRQAPHQLAPTTNPSDRKQQD